MNIHTAFSVSYAAARVKFLDAANAANMALQSFEHPLKGLHGETLAMDVALDGSSDAEHLFIVSSACHGVEGYCGSGVQVYAAHDEEWRAKARAAGVAVLYIHALNPYGFSHIRRVTHENVDLNRNFQDFSKALPVNEAYRALHGMLLPEKWPPTAENQTKITSYIDVNSEAQYQSAVTRGQYEFSDGMYFGGTEATWSNHILREVLKKHGQKARHIAWMDLHTGLGPSAVGERIFACKDDSQALERARAWWGGGGKTPVTSFYDGSSSSPSLSGMMWGSVYDECPQAQYTGIAMEYGTLSVVDVIAAVRADHWLHKHPEAPQEQQAAIKQLLMNAFYVDTDEWRDQIIAQARQAMFQAVDGLSTS
ncbi:hypothetical protein AwPolaro_02560 [Polaromonas sp.]|nr:hypothetical protein AwPolaro_02560 [Polaromonas sp.]